MARPTDFEPKFCEIALRLCANGATDREVAEELEIHEATLYRWKHQHPEFREALKVGKEAADDRVENALYRRAVGYSFDAVKIMSYEGEAFSEPYVEHVPPDVNAIKLWLTNRRSKDWRERMEHSGPNGGEIPVKASVEFVRTEKVAVP